MIMKYENMKITKLKIFKINITMIYYDWKLEFSIILFICINELNKYKFLLNKYFQFNKKPTKFVLEYTKLNW